MGKCRGDDVDTFLATHPGAREILWSGNSGKEDEKIDNDWHLKDRVDNWGEKMDVKSP
jgi:cytochrome b involved in lipid metabolism